MTRKTSVFYATVVLNIELTIAVFTFHNVFSVNALYSPE